MSKVNEINGKLSKFKREHGFEVPENYFDGLPMRIQMAIAEEKHSSVFISVFKNKPRFVYAFSFAIFVLLLIGGYFYLNDYSDKKLTSEDLIEYAVYSENVLDEYAIINEIQTAENTADTDSADAIIEYLIADNIEYSTILEDY
jgi:hypothetical protein